MATDADLRADIAELRHSIDLINTRLRVQGGVQCTELRPHDTLVFQRGPNVYVCECAKVYRKDGHGGLMEVS